MLFERMQIDRMRMYVAAEALAKEVDTLLPRARRYAPRQAVLPRAKSGMVPMR